MLFDINKESFKQMVLKSEIPVLIDFHAPWCRSCLSLETILEDISDDYYGQIKIYKINVEDETAISDKYDVMTLPTLILFDRGKVIKELNGLQSASEIRKWLDL